MINWPITREDIFVSRDESGRLFIKVGDEENSFMVSAPKNGPTMPAISLLMENICRKILGVTEHDFLMKVSEFFESEDD